MSLFIASLNSGSNGNCYYVGNADEAVLIDAGLSCRETEKRMKRLGLSMESVKAVFISHEHSDHISGLEALHAKFRLPVYITQATHRYAGCDLQQHLVYSFTAGHSVQIGNLIIYPFTKNHDAADPHSFMICYHGVNVGVITDAGHACAEVIKCFQQSHAVFLESNYCDDMLANGSYPAYLKKRISSRVGHMSNRQALDLFLKHRTEQLQLLLLSHLSENNNSPETVRDLFMPHAGKTRIIIAGRDKQTELFEVIAGKIPAEMKMKTDFVRRQEQLSLFQ